jgi:hypothetical protein
MGKMKRALLAFLLMAAPASAATVSVAVMGTASNPFGTTPQRGRAYCTCGASYMWYGSTGHCPAWTENAIDWATAARKMKWQEFTYPAEHALIMWPGAGRNHVGS